jgi:2,4-dienoyl-CoA reductase-like NADH-dependent reductase (Old Yellow Enzyme family)/thioredoxin reductase
MNQYYPHLFQPFQIKNTVFKNRIFSAPNMMCHMDANGFPTEYMLGYYAAKAKGGAAVVTIGDTPVDFEHAPSNPRSFQLSYSSLPQLSELAMAIHEHGALASLELNHGGAVNPPNAMGWRNPIGPVAFVRDWDGVQVEAMDEDMMNTVADHFAEKAELLKIAGFDLCLLHGGHGWLLHQFLSPLTNTRTDAYGGSLKNRARFPLMVIDRVRQRVGDNFLIEYRMSGDECIKGGYGIEEAIQFAHLIDGKVDLIHVSAALDTEEAQAVITHPTMFLPHGVNVKYAEAIKNSGVNTPIVTIGAISAPDMAEAILAEGRADVIAMTRALIADPDFPNKAKCGRADEIIPCLRCLDCLTGMHTGQHFQCAVNCRTGREFRYDNSIKPSIERKKILVVGGGPGGMWAAVTAAQRGHDVTLAEKTGTLGGLLNFTDYDDLKIDLKRLKDYLLTMVRKSNVAVRCNTEVTAEFVKEGNYDAVIVAVGSTPAMPPIPGLQAPDVQHATAVYTELDRVGKTVAVLGGGLVGCETGLFLAEHGHNVVMIELQSDIAPEANWMHKEGMLQAFTKAPITCRTSLKVSRIENGGVYAVDKNGAEEFIPADTVVYALGMRANAAVAEALADSAPYVRAVGDCVRPRKVAQALQEGFWAAIDLS